jgi:poly-gamma-glutamate synthesis protein (capsule biosynthesis protein)
MLRVLLRLIFFAAHLIRPGRFRASRPVEGNSAHFEKGEAFWWGYKYFYKQIEESEPGKGIAEFFAAHTMDWTPPPGFVPETTVTLSSGGDIMPTPHLRPDTTAHLWDETEDFFFSSDLAVANLEAPIANKALSAISNNVLAPPAMNNTPEAFDICWRGGRGITCYATANNHALDMGAAGLRETLDFLDAKGAVHVGTSRSAGERDAFPVLDIRGVRIAVLAYTFSLNRQKPPEGQDYLVNHLRLNRPDTDIRLIREHIRIAREEKKADLVIACLHWSLEFESFPTENTMIMGHRLLEAGIDIILGNHAHTLQSAEQYTWRDSASGREKRGLILYSQGDLISWHHPRNSRLSALCRIRLEKGRLDGFPLTLIRDVQFMPLYSYLAFDRKNHCTDFRLLNLSALAARIREGSTTLPLTVQRRREILRLRDLQKRALPLAP